MGFVSCEQHKKSQEVQDKEIEELGNNAISADDTLLDKSSGKGGGEITVEKIKAAVAGDVTIAVKEKSGISGNGSKNNPLALELGDSLQLDSNGKVQINPTAVANIRLVDASGEIHLGYIRGSE